MQYKTTMHKQNKILMYKLSLQILAIFLLKESNLSEKTENEHP